MPRGNPELAKAMGQRLIARRKELGLTQEAVADMAGITHQQYNKAENGKVCLSADSLHRISVALQISTDFLLSGNPNNERHQRTVNLLDQMNDSQLMLAHNVLKCIVEFGSESSNDRKG